MRVVVTARPPHRVKGDAVVQLFTSPLGGARLPLSQHMRPGSAKLVLDEDGGLTWLQPQGMAAPRLLLVGDSSSGESAEPGVCGNANAEQRAVEARQQQRRLGATIERALDGIRVSSAVLAPTAAADVGAILEGILMRAYASVEFVPDDEPSSLSRVTVCAPSGQLAQTKREVAETIALCEATNWARGLADLPSNVGTPAGIAERMRPAATEAGLGVEVLNAAALGRMGMRLLLGVGAGAGAPPVLCVLEHGAARKKTLPTLVLVGKGVTHDTGGYNLKRTPELHELSYDKSGATAVLGAMVAIARLAVPAHVVGLVPLVENCVDAHAYKPGDILKALDGTTVFIESTDAEGRLALADCLSYAKRYRPDLVLDIATLTLASEISLGPPFSSLFSNDDAARDLLVAAGEHCGERVWPMPIHADHADALRHPRAELRNLAGSDGGACSAAAFLRHFTAFPWAHIDMAGKGYAPEERHDVGPGATGYGTRLLVRAAQRFAQLRGERG